MIEIFTSQLPLTLFFAWVFSDVLKYVFALISPNIERSPRLLFEGGGFPSSHTTLVTTLFVFLGLTDGWAASTTMIAMVLALIVTYDAINVRLETENHAKALNKLKNEYKLLDGKDFEVDIGHTTIEIVGGIILGIIIAWMSYMLF